MITIKDIRKGHPFGVSSTTDARSVLHSRQLFFFATPEAYEAFYHDELKMPQGSKASLPRGVKNTCSSSPTSPKASSAPSWTAQSISAIPTIRCTTRRNPSRTSSLPTWIMYPVSLSAMPSPTTSCPTSPSIPTRATHEAGSWHKKTSTSWQEH